LHLLILDAGDGYSYTGAEASNEGQAMRSGIGGDAVPRPMRRDTLQLASVAAARRDNLPAEISSFIGREAAIAQVAELLSAHRLVTLSGPPGVGKTRLALRIASDLGPDFPDGIWLVELAALAEAGLVPAAVASALGLREDGQRTALELIGDHLRSARVLLMLDNCEHLTDACATLVDTLLRACPRLRVLATSREPLGLTGEVCWSVQSLTMPDVPHEPSSTQPELPDRTQGRARAQAHARAILDSESGRLFVERAQAVRPSFAVSEDAAAAIAQICRRLDGIPLAIELAAARVAALTPREIAARLDDRFQFLGRTGRAPLPRQRTLRASVDWSYDLLSEPERALLRRLAVFRGGWTLDAAEHVASGAWRVESKRQEPLSTLTLHAPLDLMASLVEKSLVQAEEWDGETRYSFLETLREYAADRLREAGEEASLIERHRAWCVDLTEQAAHHLRTPDQAAWRTRLALEQDNLRAALGRTIERGEAEPGLRICIALWHFWIDRGDAGEGYGWLTRLLRLESASGRTVIRAAALFVAAKLAFEGGDVATAQALGEESLVLAREVGDSHTLHRVLTQLGHVARGRGALLAARRFYQEALPIRRELGEPVDVAVSLACLGHIARALREYETARALYDESLALAVCQGHPAEITAAQHDLGRLAHEQGNDHEAAAWYAEALPVALQIDHPRRMAYLLEGFAVLAASGQPERAIRLAGAAAALRRASGSMLPPSDRAALDRQLEPARHLLGDDRVEGAWQAGAALTAEEAVALALRPALTEPRCAAAPPSKLSSPTPSSPDRLTAREREVVTLVARGLTNRQIAETLVVSERTAEWHVANTLGKLGLSTRAQLAVWAASSGPSVSDEIAREG
jgi:predicted ATPase/DNA-binding CsgD family transcriptional regulator